MVKNILLTLGVTGAVADSLFAMVSCSNGNPEQMLIIKYDKNPIGISIEVG